MSSPSQLARAFGALAFLALGAATFGCPSGKCFVRFKTVENGQTTSDKCLVDSCPKNAEYIDAKSACDCKSGFVTLSGACVTVAEANASCGAAYQYANGGCVAKTCAAGAVLNASTGACENRASVDAAVAAKAGVEIKAGQSLGCPAGFTYVVNDRDGACVPNELTCGTGTKFEGGKCVAASCPAGQVFDTATGTCVKLATGEDKTMFSVQAKLKAAMGPDFCAPHAKNPGGFNVAPGQATTIKVTVTINVPGNNIESTQLVGVKTTNVGGAELTPALFPGVAKINKQVDEQTIPGIRALGGKSIEATATAEVSCVIKRAPIQVIETQGGGI